MVKSPRFLRPHTVYILNTLGEENWTEVSSMTEVGLVKVQEQRSKTFGNTGGKSADSILVIIDMNDYRSEKAYIDPEDFGGCDTSRFWTARPGDRINANRVEYQITSVKRTDPLRGAPEFLEIVAS